MSYDVVVLGAGYAGSRVCSAASSRGQRVLAAVRSADRAANLTGRGFEVTTRDVLELAESAVDAKSHVIVTFPPDGVTDERLAPRLTRARAVSYLSTTGVYQDFEGVVDDTTPLPQPAAAKYARVVAAEQAYRALGAAVLRAPGIYGPDRGLHVRLQQGTFRLSGDGSGFGSRIHVEDLAELLLASARTPGETFVVGDLEPCPQRELVAFICERLSLPWPDSAPLDQVHETLRRNRRVDGRRALQRLGVELRFPSFRQGLSHLPRAATAPRP